MSSKGFLPGCSYSDWKPAAFSSCLTGSAQIAVVCYRLFEQTGDVKYGKTRIIDETGVESTIETQVMRVRVPYYLILPGTDGFQEDYALIFPESRGPALLQAGFRLNNHPDI